jgi:hypothetical protein
MPSVLDRLAKALPGSETGSALVSLAPATPKRRAAVVAHDGFLALDTYHHVKPTLFVAGLVGTVGSAIALYARRRRGPEAWGVWAMAMGISAGVAWVARPGATPGNRLPTASEGQGQPALAAVNAWLDRRAAALDRSEPGWEEKALSRLFG